MKGRRFSVEQIVGILEQAEVGVPVVQLVRKVGISEQTFYRRKKRFVGLQIDQVRLRLPTPLGHSLGVAPGSLLIRRQSSTRLIPKF